MVLHKFLIIGLTCIFVASANAALFKHVDANGVTTYSDVEVSGSKEIIPTKGNTVALPKYKTKLETEPDENNYYVTFEIKAPVNDSTIRANDGSLTVNLALVPGLKADDGDRISVFVDDKQVISNSTSLSNPLINIDRGSHTIYAVITDSNKKTLISSETVSIHLKRFRF